MNGDILILLGSVPVDNSASIFGSTNGSTPILLDELACIGNETSLFNCSHEPLGVSDCNQKELAGVICEGMWIMNLY